MSTKKRSTRRGQSSVANDQLHSATPDWSAHILTVTVLLSAFLLFQVQPLIGRIILPWYGGSPAVWTTSMFFFQVLLLIGYCYAHVTSTYLTIKVQAAVHIGLVALGLLCLPIQPAETWKPTGSLQDPTWTILGLLSRTVGIPFLLLSTTAPLVQVWWHRLYETTPYRLYAVSNAGSLIALLSYPFLVEPNLGSRSQVLVWSIGFVVVAALITGAGWFFWRGPRAVAEAATDKEIVRETHTEASAPGWQVFGAWLALSCCGSVLLLAMTNHISQNVAVVPFLWIAPLALYLLSFILTFGEGRFYSRSIFGVLMIVSQIGCAVLYRFDSPHHIAFLITIHLVAMFCGCMVCHGELVRLKPAPRHLTTFYVMISLGGALGGFSVSLLAPKLFLNYYEYPVVLIACWLVLIMAWFQDRQGRLHKGRPLWAWGVILVAFALFLTCLRDGVINTAFRSFVTKRSFYGVLSVQSLRDEENNEMVQLVHGIISHGTQYLDAQKQYVPTAYYRPESGLGHVMRHIAGRPDKRVCMLGMGVGTVAAYCEPGDIFRVYEINPQVVEIATEPEIFTYWSRFDEVGASQVIVVGDARISMEQELSQGKPQNFDVIVLDVFSGDAIPIHLVTEEAFHIYQQHLAPRGIIAVHISNRHLNLLSVLNAMSARFQFDSAYVADGVSEWVLMGTTADIEEMMARGGGSMRAVPRTAAPVLWTDDYSDIFSVLR